ncbi:MAG TPA: hypothetical protein VKU41_29425 [Polyangiaceae bacterium]|nr:hypothetical protein [Polyangiaceae bacterium]
MRWVVLASSAVVSGACTASSNPSTLLGDNPVDAAAGMPDGALQDALGEASPAWVPDGAGQVTDAGATAAAGESAAPEAAVCDRHFPPCPSPAPSYAQVIVPVVMMECLACHYAGNSTTRNSDYTTYEGIYKDRGSILNQLFACEMPPSTYPALTSDERTAFLEWLECGAPNN